ncbi:MAG: twin-arginine translocation signal domain-containing protein [Faecalibacterium sp.]
MSLEFNRRSFLKYSAAAAVAVAGSSLLTGCGEDEYQKTGKIGSTLKLMGTFKMYDGTDAPHTSITTGYFHYPAIGTFKCKLNSSALRTRFLCAVTRGNFELTVNSTGKSKDDVDYLDTAITVKRQGAGSSGGKFDLTTDDGEQDFDITVTGVTLKNNDKVEFKYWPRIQASSGNSGYTRAFCTWKMTAKVDATTGKVTFE